MAVCKIFDFECTHMQAHDLADFEKITQPQEKITFNK